MNKTASSIEWPEGFPRTAPDDREKNSSFSATIAKTSEDLETEMGRLDPDSWRASTASGGAYTKSTGLPKHNANPDDPGFVLYWKDEDEQYAVACDESPRLRDNLRSVLLWVRETRLRSNRPVETGESEFAAARLPPGNEDREKVVPDVATEQEAAEFLNVQPSAPNDFVKKAFRAKSKEVHPDKESGSEAEFKKAQKAKDVLLAE